jgi:hypothetical protein
MRQRGQSVERFGFTFKILMSTGQCSSLLNKNPRSLRLGCFMGSGEIKQQASRVLRLTRDLGVVDLNL